MSHNGNINQLMFSAVDESLVTQEEKNELQAKIEKLERQKASLEIQNRKQYTEIQELERQYQRLQNDYKILMGNKCWDSLQQLLQKNQRIKELKTEIEKMKTKIEDLETKIENYEKLDKNKRIMELTKKIEQYDKIFRDATHRLQHINDSCSSGNQVHTAPTTLSNTTANNFFPYCFYYHSLYH